MTDEQTIGIPGSFANDLPLSYKFADKAVSTLFSVEPVFDFISKKARENMVTRAKTMGISWRDIVGQLEEEQDQIQEEYTLIDQSSVILVPEYYKKPFHAYKEGNLCWQAAYETEAAAYTVHAPIFTETRNELESDGDEKLRRSFLQTAAELLDLKYNDYKPSEENFGNAQDMTKDKLILDIGCSTGLSSIALAKVFPC